jgi:RND superfamily putative drug exporter
MFSSLSGVVSRRPWFVVLGWLAVTGGLHVFAPTWEHVTKDDDVRFFPPNSLSVIGQDLLERGFAKDASISQLVLVYERNNERITPSDLQYIENVALKFYQFAQSHPELAVNKLDTHRSPVIGPRLIGKVAEDGSQAVLTIVRLNGTYLSQKSRRSVDSTLDWLAKERPRPPAGLRLSVTGSAVVGRDTNAASKESITNTTRSTIFLVVLILLVVYRSPLLAMIPLVTIALSVFASLHLIALLTWVPGLGFKVINITRVFVVVVLFGAGTDYCLFLIARYTEELRRGRSAPDALRESINQVGAALVASAGTVIVGLGMLYFSSFAKVKYTGPTIALSLGVALLAALTLAPALMALLRGALFWPFHTPHRSVLTAKGRASPDALISTGFWVRAADLVVSYPLAILSVCLLVLLPLAVVGARTRSNHNQLSDLDPDRVSVIGASAVKRYFSVGELSPAVALIENPQLDFRSERGRSAIAEISRRLQSIDDVADIRSLTQPLGKTSGSSSETGLLNRLAGQAISAAVESRYVCTKPARESDVNHITRIDVVFRTDPFSESSIQALDRVNAVLRNASLPAEPLEGAKAIGIAGSSSAVHDLKEVTTHDERRMYLLVTTGVNVILVIL